MTPTAPNLARVVAVVFRNELLAYLRNRTAMFWVFLFPLLIFCTLGFAVGTDIGPLDVRIVDADRSAASAAFAEAATGALLANQVVRTTVAADNREPAQTRHGVTLGIPAGFGSAVEQGRAAPVTLRWDGPYSSAIYVAQQTVERSALQFALARRAGGVRVEVATAGAAGSPAHYEQFLFSGIIVLMLLSGGVLSLSMALAGQREQNMYRYYAVWPLPPALYLSGVIAARVCIMVGAAMLFLLVGRLVFGLPASLEPARLAGMLGLTALGAALFCAVGFVLASVCRSLAAVELVANLIYYPAVLLGDITVPLRELPYHLDDVLRWSPAAQLAAALRQQLFGGATPAWPLFAGLGGAILVLLLTGHTLFRFQLKETS